MTIRDSYDEPEPEWRGPVEKKNVVIIEDESEEETE
jgi:hypothetical protein